MNENNSEREKVVYGSGFVLPTIIKCLQQELAMSVFIPSAMRIPAGKGEDAFRRK